MSDAEQLRNLLASVSRTPLASLPTPIHRLENLSNELGINLYCMRDDLTGFAFNGNKCRKLEYLTHQALDANVQTIVTCGSNQSNWCRMAAAAGITRGMNVHLVLGGEKPDRPTGNLLLNHMLGVEIEHLPHDDDGLLERRCEKILADKTQAGERAMHWRMGGSNWLGSLGYAKAFLEILDFESQSDMKFSAIVVATGSGGTQAGLVTGQSLSSWDGDIIGMAVSRSADRQRQKIEKILQELKDEMSVELDSSAIVMEDSYVGEGYRKRTEACREAIELFARKEGIFLDQVYTGKAAAGLIDYARTNRLPHDSNILFIHTGGNIQLFE